MPNVDSSSGGDKLLIREKYPSFGIRDLNKNLVISGLAESTCSEYMDAQSYAQHQKVGIWTK